VSGTREPPKSAYDLSHAPRSLLAGANRLHFDRVVELFATIRQDCDDMAATLQLTSQDDGLAAVKFLAEALLDAVRQERDDQKKTRQPRRKSGPHESTVQFKRDWEATFPAEKNFRRASAATIDKWIAELDENLRLRKTRAGKIITPFEARQIEAYRNRLEERRAAIEAGKIKRPTIGQVRDRLAEQFVATGFYGKPGKGKDARTYVDEKLKRARRSARKK
jgi:hypothetical protein